MEYGYLQAGLVDFAIIFLLLIFSGWFTLWGLSGGLKKFFTFKKKKENRGHQGW